MTVSSDAADDICERRARSIVYLQTTGRTGKNGGRRSARLLGGMNVGGARPESSHDGKSFRQMKSRRAAGKLGRLKKIMEITGSRL